MKLCFSTLTCPDWSKKDIIVSAKDLDFDGVEIRATLPDLLNEESGSGFSKQLADLIAGLKNSGLSVPIISSDIALAENPEDDVILPAEKYIDFASSMGIPYIRVLNTSKPEPTGGDLDLSLDRYKTVCAYAEGKNVMPLIETNGVFSDSRLLAGFLYKAGCSNAGALWDVHHPYRFMNESPFETAENLKGLIHHVHVKDSVVIDNTITYRMMGHGDVPVNDCLFILEKSGYDGFISLEWVRRWNRDLEDPGVVLPHFSSYMKTFFK